MLLYMSCLLCHAALSPLPVHGGFSSAAFFPPCCLKKAAATTGSKWVPLSSRIIPAVNQLKLRCISNALKHFLRDHFSYMFFCCINH